MVGVIARETGRRDREGGGVRRKMRKRGRRDRERKRESGRRDRERER